MAIINHLGVIVDGNGRWAKEKGLKRTDGHTAGAKKLEWLILHVAHEKIANYLSLYVFSTENFGRPETEVNYLMQLFMKWFTTVKKKYKKENIKILFSGRKEYLKDDVANAMTKLEEDTKDNTGLVVNFCLSYGGRTELVDATKRICRAVMDGSISIDDINEDTIEDNLYHKLPNIDFLIRTSGENRISNFMLWQISYAEFYFPKVYFPDFDINYLNEALEEYKRRDRRFGKIDENK